MGGIWVWNEPVETLSIVDLPCHVSFAAREVYHSRLKLLESVHLSLLWSAKLEMVILSSLTPSLQAERLFKHQ